MNTAFSFLFGSVLFLSGCTGQLAPAQTREPHPSRPTGGAPNSSPTDRTGEDELPVSETESEGRPLATDDQARSDAPTDDADGAVAADGGFVGPSMTSVDGEQAGVPEAAPVPERAPASGLPAGTKVLHVGDSFAGALGVPLGKVFESQGIHSVLKHTDASYLTDWAWDGQLQKYLWKYNPDLVIITLGANELGIAEPERRIKTIDKIISTIGDRPCLWVGIPLWQGRQNGLMDIIRDHVAPCVYWDSNEILDVEAMPRISDGIHPTSSAREAWAQVLAEWLARHRSPRTGQPWALKP